MSALKIPDTPVIVAGGIGGPSVMLTVTPMRNALTLGATSSTSSAAQLYGQVFSRGFLRGWTGGIYPAMAACPQFLCLGPAYHMYAGVGGVPFGVVAAGFTESMIVYGAETANAQMAMNMKKPGAIQTLQPAYKPYGPGVSIYIARNVISTAGLRLFCSPCTAAIESLTGKKNVATQIGGDFTGNVIAACLSMPMHQLYGFIVTTPDLWDKPFAEQKQRMVGFLKGHFLTKSESGAVRLSSTIPRDLFMRSMYIAIAYTMFSTLERTLVAYWPKKN